MSQSTVHLTLAGSQKSQVILMPLTIIIIIILIVINIIILMPLPHQNRFPKPKMWNLKAKFKTSTYENLGFRFSMVPTELSFRNIKVI